VILSLLLVKWRKAPITIPFIGEIVRDSPLFSRSGLSEKRLAITTYGKVRYQLKTPYSDRTTGNQRSDVIFEPLNFIARLGALVPKPRINLSRLDEKQPCFSSFRQPMVVQVHSLWICHGVFVWGGLPWGGPPWGGLHQTVGTTCQ